MPVFPIFPNTAPSVSASGHEMRDELSNHDPPRPTPYTAPSVTPYLGLRSRLSQIWFNRWTILLMIVLARILIACSSLDSNLTSSRAQALSACSNVEAMGSAMVSMPHYMAQGVNELTAGTIDRTINAMASASVDAVDAAEGISIFMINLLVGTWLCWASLVANGTAKVAGEVLVDSQVALNNLTQGIGDDLADSVGTFLDTYNAVKDKLSGGILGLGTSITLPDLDLNSTIDQLRNLQLPPSLGDKIDTINKTAVSYANVKSTTTDAVNFGFDQVRQLINTSWGAGNYSFDRSLFPVPEKQVVTFCTQDNGIDQFFDELAHVVSLGKKIFIAVLVLAAILVCIPMAYREMRRWRITRDRAKMVGSHSHDPLDVVYIVSRPYTSSAGVKLADHFKSDRHQALVRWVVAYATSEAALFVLSLALASLFACLCQYVLLRSVQKEVPALVNQVAGFADKVVQMLNNQSNQWAASTNKIIDDTNRQVNDDMFSWATNGTALLNNTLNSFVDGVTEAVNVTFGGTPLHDPVQDILNCLLLVKIQGIEQGLTFIHDHAHVNFPNVRNDTFSVGAAASINGSAPPDQSFLATAGDAAADKVSNVVVTLVNALLNQVRTEALIAAFILAVYLVAVLSAIVRAAVLWNRQEKVRGDGGAVPDVHEPDTDFRSNNQDRYGNFNDFPLTAVNHYNGPAPRYSTAVEEKALQEAASNPFSDSKRSRSFSE